MLLQNDMFLEHQYNMGWAVGRRRAANKTCDRQHFSICFEVTAGSEIKWSFTNTLNNKMLLKMSCLVSRI